MGKKAAPKAPWREFFAKVSPRLTKWLLFDLVCGLLPLILRAGIAWFGTSKVVEKISFTNLAADGELALIAAVLMASCAGELYLMDTPTVGLKVTRLICGFACGGIIVGSSLYFALVKTKLTTPDWTIANCVLFVVVVIAGALMTTMAEARAA
jgi:hypothetical protein